MGKSFFPFLTYFDPGVDNDITSNILNCDLKKEKEQRIVSGIKEALSKLDEKVMKLESALNAKAIVLGKAKSPDFLDQPDMFALPSNQNDPNAKALTKEEVVQQLDIAISKVEQLLSGSAQ